MSNCNFHASGAEPLGVKANATENTGKYLTRANKRKLQTMLESTPDDTTKADVVGVVKKKAYKRKQTEDGMRRRDINMLSTDDMLEIFQYIRLDDLWKSVRMVDRRFHEICAYTMTHHLVIDDNVDEKVAEGIFKKYHPNIRAITLQKTTNTNKLLEFIPKCRQLLTLKMNGCRGLVTEDTRESISETKLRAVLSECKRLTTFEFISSGLEKGDADLYAPDALIGRHMKRLYVKHITFSEFRDQTKKMLEILKQHGVHFKCELKPINLFKEITLRVDNAIVSMESIKTDYTVNNYQNNRLEKFTQLQDVFDSILSLID